jgi:hypothetical protein
MAENWVRLCAQRRAALLLTVTALCRRSTWIRRLGGRITIMPSPKSPRESLCLHVSTRLRRCERAGAACMSCCQLDNRTGAGERERARCGPTPYALPDLGYLLLPATCRLTALYVAVSVAVTDGRRAPPGCLAASLQRSLPSLSPHSSRYIIPSSLLSCRWDKPEELGGEVSVNDRWQCLQDPGSGRDYYYDTVSGALCTTELWSGRAPFQCVWDMRGTLMVLPVFLCRSDVMGSARGMGECTITITLVTHLQYLPLALVGLQVSKTGGGGAKKATKTSEESKETVGARAWCLALSLT